MGVQLGGSSQVAGKKNSKEGKAKGTSSKPQTQPKPPAGVQDTQEGKVEADQIAMAQSLSTKLLSAYTQSLTWLARLHVYEFRTHAAVLVSRIALQAYKDMGVLGTAGQGAVCIELAEVAIKRGRLEEARGFLARAERLKKQAARHGGGASGGSSMALPPDLLPCLEARAQMSMWLVQYRQAKDHLQEALALTDNALAPRNSHRCGTLVVLAAYMREVGRYREAYKVLASAGRMLMSFTERSPLAYRVAMEQAALDIEVGFLDEARAALDSVEDLGVIPARHPDAAVVVWYKARIELFNYRFAAARQLLDQASRLLAASGLGLDAKHTQSRQARLERACQHAARKMSNRPMLVKFLKTIVPLAWQQLDRQEALHPLRMRFSQLHALLQVQEGSLAGAHGGLLDLIQRYTQLNPDAAATDSHPLIGVCKTGLAQHDFALGHFKEAEQGFSSALKNKQAGGWVASHISIAHDHHGMALCALALGRYKEAQGRLRDAQALFRAAAGDAQTAGSLAVELALAHLALEIGRVRPAYSLDTLPFSSLHAADNADILKRVWFMHVFLEREAGETVLRERVLKQAAAQCRALTFKAGDVVAQPNEGHPFMLILVRGSLDVLQPRPAAPSPNAPTPAPATAGMQDAPPDGQHDASQGRQAQARVPGPEETGGGFAAAGELDGWERIAQLSAGDTFGERAVLLDLPFEVCLRAPHSFEQSHLRPHDAARARAEERGVGEVLVVPRETFRVLFAALPQVPLPFVSLVCTIHTHTHTHTKTHKHTHTYVCIYIYYIYTHIYIYIVCVCVCDRERERGREGEGERD